MKAYCWFALGISLFSHCALAQLRADAEATQCPVTQGDENDFFENDALTAHVPGTVVFRPGGPGFVDHDGALGMKWPWVRNKQGQLSVGGRRLDGEAPPARAYIPEGYGDVGFQSSYLVFPTPGCWEITGGVDGSTLTFVVLVEKIGDGPSWRWDENAMPTPGWRVTTHWP
jgi:hypothetical protein